MGIRFSDGEYFDTDGPLRIERRKDGLYVVGNGFLVPVSTIEEGEELIKTMKADE